MLAKLTNFWFVILLRDKGRVDKFSGTTVAADTAAATEGAEGAGVGRHVRADGPGPGRDDLDVTGPGCHAAARPTDQRLHEAQAGRPTRPARPRFVLYPLVR